MTVTKNLKPTGLAALAAGAMLALAACSPAAPDATSSSAATSSPASTTSTVTASASPTASPGTSATVGKLVEGFPEALIPVMPGATVISSSLDKAKQPATAALVASITAPTAAVVDFYTKHLEGQGFKAVPGDAVGAVASKDFVRNDNETVNVAVVEAAGVSTFTIGANAAVEPAK
ncbi:hypothetical protein PY310_06615 [Pseudarthrobacter sp. H3Y2-7]|uniref:hypothetical protein n=1 Tax=Pseudarthrobacter TaxID=1742993 RepID=UPI0023AF720F|nr:MULTISPECIES: hypothetical protein [unclassified Pseudarthrobacter]MDE8668258.1 hypothetical protein [Pseudarthrobacter sp. H3Y2-7]